MIGNSLITQVVTIVISLVIFFTYLQPTFAGIQNTQNDIDKFKQELATVNEVHDKLNQLIQRRNSLSAIDRQRLFDYLPEVLDEVKVLRDLGIMTETPGLNLNIKSIDYKSSGGTSRSTGSTQTNPDAPLEHSFSVSFTSSFEQLKTFLTILERNNYPLDIDSLKITAESGGFLNVDLGLITYSKK